MLPEAEAIRHRHAASVPRLNLTRQTPTRGGWPSCSSARGCWRSRNRLRSSISSPFTAEEDGRIGSRDFVTNGLPAPRGPVRSAQVVGNPAGRTRQGVQPARRLPLGCRSTTRRLPLDSPSAAVDNPSAAARLPVGCLSAKVLVYKPLGPFDPENSNRVIPNPDFRTAEGSGRDLEGREAPKHGIRSEAPSLSAGVVVCAQG